MNVAAGLVLAGSRRGSINVEAAFRHVFADLLGSIGVAFAAVVILATDWVEADAVVSILIGVSSSRAPGPSTAILLESAPRGLDADALGRRAEALGRRLAGAPGVVEVHDLHRRSGSAKRV